MTIKLPLKGLKHPLCEAKRLKYTHILVQTGFHFFAALYVFGGESYIFVSYINFD